MNSFALTLQEQRKGELLKELSLRFSEVVAAVRDNKRPGSLTLKLTVAPVKEGEGELVTLDDDINCKMPKPPKRRGIYYITDDARLSKDNPNQEEFEFQQVPTPSTETTTSNEQTA